MAIQIGKYKRPGIFLEEFDNSVISTPLVEGITNMVMGVSKKGPVNTPVRITTVTDFENIFGSLDRSLERKGSFFHRTVAKMLETAPVFAMNLLLTDDNLDKIEYQSLSVSSDFSNDIEREGAYRRFFDTTGFWKRDTESFINLTKSNTGYADRLLNITNLSDRYATVFIIKSSLTGFDRTLVEWYGSVDKVPAYVNANDWASDYMVDVIVVAGDWSDYKTLAVDSRWSTYFNASGLRKTQIRNFANDRNVTLLGYYEGLSLIPYFRDANGRNIFIETTLNRDTDRTGIFCSFNADLAEVDFFNGKLDLIGHTIAGKNETTINFLSYTETIAEEVEFEATPLDLPGNVTALMGTYSNATHFFGGTSDGTTGVKPTGVQHSSGFKYRTAYFSEGYVYDVKSTGTASVGTSSITMTYSITDSSYLVVGDDYVPVTATGSLSINSTDYTVSSVTASYYATFTLDSTGAFKVYKTTARDTKPTVPATDTVLSYVYFNVRSGEIKSTGFAQTNVALNNTGAGGDDSFKDLVHGTASLTSGDYYVSNEGNGSIKVTFVNTNSSPSTSNYEVYRRIKMFNKLVSVIDSANKDKVVMVLQPSGSSSDGVTKVSLSGMTITNIETSSTQNKSFTLNTGLTTPELSYVLNGFLCFYTEDKEFILGTEGFNTRMTGATSSFGIVSPNTKFYTQYFNGNINTSDYFYNNRMDREILVAGGTVSVTFFDGETLSSITGFNTGLTSSFAGYDYILIDTSTISTSLGSDQDLGLEIGKVISIKGAETNTGTFTIDSDNLGAAATGGTGDFTLSSGSNLPNNYYVYRVVEETSYEIVNNVSIINDHSDYVHYLKMYLSGGNLYVEFKDSTLESDEKLYLYNNSTPSEDARVATKFYVNSQDSNYKQTIEIESANGYTPVPNKILVKGDRYTEVMIGDFLEAEYDSSLLRIGEYPRKLTRVLSKRAYAGDTSLVEITCDSAIKKVNFEGDYQTTRYKSVDVYASTYKAISLKGFRVREASLPDGTETRQNAILNLVGRGTPLFKALTNKEALDFRYLIDSFGLGLTERSKQQYVDICGDRKDAFGFLNMPSMKSFKNSSSPTFVNSEGVLQTSFIAKGGDPESGPAFLYSFGDGAGTTCVGYFLPYLTVNDNGRPLDMPPASHVATTYMRKHISNLGGITPWTIAAGVTNGRITNIAGLEQDFTLEDIENLNQAQMNPIVFKRNRGNIIETENTAQTLYRSALSYIHVREVLIELERELSRMLLDFQWQFNTPDIRAEIKLRADLICETYVSRNGLFNYFNKMDEENNTPEIIDNQIGVLDTYVEPIKGMGIIVNNVTILRTGAIEAGGFL
jgi:hypothetical protein